MSPPTSLPTTCPLVILPFSSHYSCSYTYYASQYAQCISNNFSLSGDSSSQRKWAWQKCFHTCSSSPWNVKIHHGPVSYLLSSSTDSSEITELSETKFLIPVSRSVCYCVLDFVPDSHGRDSWPDGSPSHPLPRPRQHLQHCHHQHPQGGHAEGLFSSGIIVKVSF